MEKKCILFARVSTVIQDYSTQTDKLVEEAKRYGYDKQHQIVIEEAESGVKLDFNERKGIKLLTEYIEKDDSINMVFVWEISRLSRRPKVLYEIREYLIKHHVNLRCMSPEFTMLKDDWSIDPTASIVFSIFGTIAEEEAYQIKERMRRGKLYKANQTKYVGGKVAFGYKVDKDDNIVIDENKARIIKDMFMMYANGQSTGTIAKEMIENGRIDFDMKHKRKAMIHICSIISKEEYTGKKIKNYSYPAIVSQELYDKCKEMRKRNTVVDAKYHNYYSGIKTVYLCRGLLHDAETGHTFTPKASPKLRQYRVDIIEKHVSYCLNMDLVDKLTWDIVKEKNKNIDYKSSLTICLQKQHRIKAKKEASETKLRKYQSQIDKIEERLILGKLSDAKANQMESAITENVNEERQNVKDYNKQIEELDIEIDKISNTKSSDARTLTDEDKYKMIKNTITEIKVNKITKGVYNLVYLFNDNSKTSYQVLSRSGKVSITKLLL